MPRGSRRRRCPNGTRRSRTTKRCEPKQGSNKRKPARKSRRKSRVPKPMHLQMVKWDVDTRASSEQLRKWYIENMFLDNGDLEGQWPRQIPNLSALKVRPTGKKFRKSLTAYLTAPTPFYPMSADEEDELYNASRPWGPGLGTFMDPDDDCNYPLAKDCVQPIFGSIETTSGSMFDDSKTVKPWSGNDQDIDWFHKPGEPPRPRRLARGRTLA